MDIWNFLRAWGFANILSLFQAILGSIIVIVYNEKHHSKSRTNESQNYSWILSPLLDYKIIYIAAGYKGILFDRNYKWVIK